MVRISTLLLLLCAGLHFTQVSADATAGSRGKVVSQKSAPTRLHPKGVAAVRFLATPQHQGTKSVFVSHLSMKPGVKIPEHRDATEEVIYILKGTGSITIDGKSHRVGPGDCVYMPANALVTFQADKHNPVEVIQVFAPPGPESKYNNWKNK